MRSLRSYIPFIASDHVAQYMRRVLSSNSLRATIPHNELIASVYPVHCVRPFRHCGRPSRSLRPTISHNGNIASARPVHCVRPCNAINTLRSGAMCSTPLTLILHTCSLRSHRAQAATRLYASHSNPLLPMGPRALASLLYCRTCRTQCAQSARCCSPIIVVDYVG